VPAVAHFLCTLVHGPAWDDRRGIRDQDGFAEHATFMDRLVDDGVLLVGGPVSDGGYTAHLLDGPDAGRLRARLADDPWAKDGHLAVGVLEPWALWLVGSMVPTRDDPAGAPSI
jgi:hypothetical protein